MVREGRVFISTAGKPAFGMNYYVTAYEVGAQVASASSGTTADVRTNHGFAANDKLIVNIDPTLYRTVLSVTSSTLVLDQSLSLAEGDLLVNLGPDTGSSAPNYDGSGSLIYSDMDYSDLLVNSTTQTGDTGRYTYFYNENDIWELVRSSSGTPIAIYTDVSNPLGAVLPSSILESQVSVKTFGALGDGATDDTVAIQAAINYIGTVSGLAIGGEVFFPCGNYIISATIYLKAYVKIRGSNFSGVSDTYSINNSVTITAAAGFAGTAMFATVGSSQYYGVEMDHLRLNANQHVATAIDLDGTKEARLFNMSIQETTESAVRAIESSSGIGLETRMFNVNCTNCNTSAAASRRGVIHITQPDCFIHNCRAHMGDNTTYTSAGNRCGFYVGGSVNFFSDCYGDINEDGWVIAALGNELVNCRADRNAGHGFVVTSAVTSGSLVGCEALNNGQATTNTYDGFNVAASRVSIIGGQVTHSSVTNKHRYAYNQTSAFGADNRWIGCSAIPASYTTGLFNDTNAAGGWEFQNSYLVSAADDATPTVKNVRTLSTGGNNTTPTAITQLDDGMPNQTVRIACFSSTNYSYIADGGNFTLSGGDWTPRSGEWIELHTFTGTAWYESSRSVKSTGYLSILDGITAPGTATGRTHAYVDTADGDFKWKFGDGAVVVVTDKGGTLLSTGGNVVLDLNFSAGGAIFPAGKTLINITNVTGTNTLTVTAPSSTDGAIIILRCVALTAGTMTIADSGNCALSAAWTPDAGDTLTLVASGVIWYEIARSAN